MEVSSNMSNPTFKIHRSDGTIYPTIKKSFIKKAHISASDFLRGYLHLEDGTKWTLILEEGKVPNFGLNKKYVISFQVHIHGNFAVAREYVEWRDVYVQDKT